MKLLSQGDGRVVKIIQKNKLPRAAEYRLSRFVYSMETEAGAVLKNTLSKQVYALDAEEWTALRAGTLPDEKRDELARLRFLAEPDDDEAARYDLVLSVLRTMEKREPGIAAYTILPTTGCNARCIYCYEEGWEVKTMSARTADAAVDFICRTKREGKIRLSWFGGEPLLGAATISRICRGLADRGVTFTSSIITNATLLTPELAEQAAALWQLKSAQVSMDGARADYEKRKSYVNPALHNYDRALDAAALLADAGVAVTMRVNYDAENLPRVKEFFADCRARLGERKNVSVYMEQLFQSSTAEENAALFRAAGETEKGLAPLGLSPAVRAERRLKTNYCMADAGGRSVIIDPEGGLHRCEHDISGVPFGTVFDEMLTLPAVRTEAAEECRNCCFLPECTAFRKNGCPVQIAGCRTQMALRTERELEAVLRTAETAAEESDEDGEGECP